MCEGLCVFSFLCSFLFSLSHSSVPLFLFACLQNIYYFVCVHFKFMNWYDYKCHFPLYASTMFLRSILMALCVVLGFYLLCWLPGVQHPTQPLPSLQLSAMQPRPWWTAPSGTVYTLARNFWATRCVDTQHDWILRTCSPKGNSVQFPTSISWGPQACSMSALKEHLFSIWEHIFWGVLSGRVWNPTCT